MKTRPLIEKKILSSGNDIQKNILFLLLRTETFRKDLIPEMDIPEYGHTDLDIRIHQLLELMNDIEIESKTILGITD